MPSATTKTKSSKSAKKGSAKRAASKSAKTKPSSKKKRAAKRPTKRRASRAAAPNQRGAKGRAISFLNLGRPSVIAPDLIESICGNLAEGLSFENACIYAGIADSTGRDWMRRARVALARMDEERKRIASEQSIEPADVDVEPLDSERMFIEFSAAVKRAQAHFQITNLRAVHAGVERWQANAWLLERRAQDEYALQRGGKGEAAPPQPKGNQPIDRVVGRYTEIYVNTEEVPLPTPDQIAASAREQGDDNDAD